MLVPSTPPRRLKRLALAAAFVYMAASAMWIWLSDWGAAQLAGGDAQRFHLIQTVKGWGFVLATSIVAFFLIWRLLLASWRLAQSDAHHKRQQTELERAAERIRLLVEGSPHFFFYAQDPDGLVTYISPTVELITGRKVTDWLGQRHWFAPDTPVNRDARARSVRHQAGEFTPEPTVVEITHADGHSVIVEAFEFGAYENGRQVGVQGIAHDITQKRRAEQSLRESEERYRSLAEAAQDFIFILDRDCRVTYVNPASARQFRTEAKDLLDKSIDTLFPPEVAARQRQHVLQVFESGSPTRVESMVSYLGRPAWLDSILVPIVSDDGSVASVLGISRDITDRKRSEAVRNALQKISEAANLACSLGELYPTIHQTVAGLMPAENLYIALHDPISDTLSFPYFIDDRDPAPAPRQRGRGVTEYVLRTQKPFLARDADWETLVRQGEIEIVGSQAVDWLGVPLRTQDRTIGVLVVQSYDEGVRYGPEEQQLLSFVSAQVAMAIDRTRTVEALHASEQRLREIIEHSTNLFYSHTPEHVLTYVSPQSDWFVGCPPEEALVHWTELVTDNPINKAGFELTERAIKTGQPQPRYELELRNRQGNTLWVEVNEAPVVRDGKTVAIVGALTDITERKRAEAAVRESEERYRKLVELSPDGIAVHCEGRIVFANSAAARIFGTATPEDLIGRDAMEFVHAEDRQEVRQRVRMVLEHRRAVPFAEERMVRRDGSITETEVAAAPFTYQGKPAVQVVVRDISTRRRIEEHLRQAQKLEAIGQLAGGVAHDFNNLLQAMLSAVQVLRASSGESERLAATVAELEAHVRRGASLTRQLLLFSRREVTKPGRLDLNAVVRETIDLLRRLVRENIRTVVELCPDSLPVEGDEGQLEQVLVNLAVNAIDAMPDGGTLTIRSGHDGEDDAWFEVRDTGVGIDPELQTRIFEPFFTTKGSGKGTGLGLSVVHGIVLKHSGRIELSSTHTEGSCFRVVLPYRRGPADQVNSDSGVAAAPPRGHGERVLLVEDEPGARAGLAEMLTMLGYAVTAVDSAEQAEALPDQPGHDLLITDLMLPGIHGGELANRLSRRWRRLRVIVMSGYTEDEAIRHGVRQRALRFLQKPFDMATLAAEVRAALDEG